MATTLVWHLWPGRHWPASAAEETQFVHELRTSADGRAATAERMDVTAVLNALRCGLTFTELHTCAPGIDPAALLAAYDELEARRAECAAAWQAIIAHPTLATITEHAEHASRLLPVPVRRIVGASAIVTAASLKKVAASEAGEVRAAARRAADAEAALVGRTPPDKQGVAIGVVLHNPRDPGLWGLPYFLPPRVGALSPLRVADLLGERPQ